MVGPVRRIGRLLGNQRQPGARRGVDRLVRHTRAPRCLETPEIYGGEHLLTRRAVHPGRRQAGSRASAGGRRLRTQRRRDGTNNPSAGNKAGCRRRSSRRASVIAKSGRRTWSTSSSTRAGDREGSRLHGHARVTTRSATSGRRRRDLICFTTDADRRTAAHPRLRLKLPRPTPRSGSNRKTTSTSIAATSSIGTGEHRRDGRAHLPPMIGPPRAEDQSEAAATARTSSFPGRSAR
jgi:hypothetical protein